MDEYEEYFQTICKVSNWDWYEERVVDMSSFKNGSFCLLFKDNIMYYSKHYEYLYEFSLDYNPTHLLTLTINSELYVVIRNSKSIYLYLLKDEFLYKTQIHLMSDIDHWTKTKDNQIIICSKNKISFYKIYNNYIIKSQNDVIIDEETYIENSLYFKNKKETNIKAKKNSEENTNSHNLSVVKIFESDDDYIIIIKQVIDEIENYVGETDDCPCCSYYIVEQTNVILLSMVKLNKKEKKMKIIYEIEFKNIYKYYEPPYGEYTKINSMEYFDKSICDSIGFSKNKVLVYIPQLNNVKIIDINSSFGHKYESFLYTSGEDIVRYKIIVISEKCFLRIKYEYDKDLGDIDYTELSFIYNNKKNHVAKFYRNLDDIPFIKKMNSLLFVLTQNNLTISKQIINNNDN